MRTDSSSVDSVMIKDNAHQFCMQIYAQQELVCIPKSCDILYKGFGKRFYFVAS